MSAAVKCEGRCPNCGADASTPPFDEEIDDNTQQYYYKCPYCGTEYRETFKVVYRGTTIINKKWEL